jgi:hypothetical protein
MTEDEVEKKIKTAAKILHEQYERTGDEDDIIKDKEEVLSYYQKLFSQDNISKLQWNDFEKFLEPEKNLHRRSIHIWKKSLKKWKKSLKNQFEKNIKDKLGPLLDESQDIKNRINRFIDEIKDMEIATTTLILLVTHPESYGVWDKISEWNLKILGLWLITYDEKSTKELSKGDVYEKVNDVLIRLSKEMHIDLWTLDAIMWYYYNNNKGKIPLSLQENDKYTRRDIHNIFYPEFKFSEEGGGKISRSGVVTLDLGIRKDYILFYIRGREPNLKEPEEITNVGNFNWITQDRMKDKNIPQAEELKKNNPEEHRVLLFGRDKPKANENEPYKYYGPLEFIREYEDKDKKRRFVYKLQSNLSTPDPLIKNVPEEIKKPESNSKLTKEEPPSFNPPNEQGGNNNQNKSVKKARNYNDEENKALGKAGEELVLKYEREKLKNYPELLNKIEHTSSKNDDAGYDILSFTEDGKEMLIEVKTTRRDASYPFLLSYNEYNTAMNNIGRYYIYRVYEFNHHSDSKYYVLSGKLDEYNPKCYKYIFSPSKT